MNWLHAASTLDRVVMEDGGPLPNVNKLFTLLCNHPNQRCYYRTEHKLNRLFLGRVCNSCGQIQMEFVTNTTGVSKSMMEALYGTTSLQDS